MPCVSQPNRSLQLHDRDFHRGHYHGRAVEEENFAERRQETYCKLDLHSDPTLITAVLAPDCSAGPGQAAQSTFFQEAGHCVVPLLCCKTTCCSRVRDRFFPLPPSACPAAGLSESLGVTLLGWDRRAEASSSVTSAGWVGLVSIHGYRILLLVGDQGLVSQ